MFSTTSNGNIFLVVFSLLLSFTLASYHPADPVPAYLSTTGPYRNRYETYAYSRLPYCPSVPIVRKTETLGEALQGMELIDAQMQVKFMENVTDLELCAPYQLDAQQARIFRFAVQNQYWFEIYIDDLPQWDYVGILKSRENATSNSSEVVVTSTEATMTEPITSLPSAVVPLPSSDSVPFLYTHRDFTIGYNEDKIVEFNVTSSNPVSLEPSSAITVHFTYSIRWIERDLGYKNRFDRYLDSHFFEQKGHWFSLLNSFLIVVFLSVLVTLILFRILRRDLAKFEQIPLAYQQYQPTHIDWDQEIGNSNAEETGWRLLHGDVFRSPKHRIYYAALIGVGRQMICSAIIVCLLTIYYDLYEDRAAILTTTVFVYGFTSVIGGYISSKYYKENGGKNWVKNVFITASIWPVFCAIIGLPVNAIAMWYSSSRAIPFTTMVVMFFIWMFICVPLTLLGSIFARYRRQNSMSQFPCRINPIQRHIPEKSLLYQPFPMFLLSGIIPFATIVIETYMIFTSFWSYKIYYVYGFMMGVGVMLTIVTACVSVVSTYLLISVEDWEWQWRCWTTGGSVSVYVLVFSVYFFYEKTKMSGVFQTAFYFGYTLLGCVALFLMMGSVAQYAANRFIRRIYKNIKVD